MSTLLVVSLLVTWSGLQPRGRVNRRSILWLKLYTAGRDGAKTYFFADMVDPLSTNDGKKWVFFMTDDRQIDRRAVKHALE